MKKKISRILGVGLTIALLTSLMVLAAPVAAGDLVYTAVSTPSTIGKVLEAGSEIDLLAVAPDGSTMFAFDTGVGLYKSTNAGVSWSKQGATLGVSLPTTAKVAMAISPDYATDKTVVVVDTTTVYISVDGGVNFAAGPALTLGGGTISSVDLGRYYATGVVNVLVGVTGTAAIPSNVLRFPLAGAYAWSNVGALIENVLAVRFSPAHVGDAQILAVSANATNTNLNTQFGTSAWNLNIPVATVLTGATATGAVIGLGSDYLGTGTNTVLVGTSGSAADDVIRVSGIAMGVAGTVKALLVTGAAGPDIRSIAVSGPIATASVLVGVVGDANVYRTSNVAASSVTNMWSLSAKDATGNSPIVLLAGGSAYAGTIGADSAFSKSTDGGANFNQLSLIDVSAVGNMSLVDSAIVNDSTMFVIMSDNTGTLMEMLFKTTNGGTSWERILTLDALARVKASPAYATDSTLYVSDGSMLLRKSSDGGATFTSLGAPAPVTALAVVDKDTYFTGATAALYKSGRWAAATGLQTVANVVSIALSPGYATDKTILTGNNDGDVYISTDDGVTFTRVGIDDEMGNGATVIILPDPKFATNKTTYAGSSANTSGIMRATSTAVSTTTASFKVIDTDNTSLIVNGLVVDAAGNLYAASGAANKGIRRSLAPLTAIAGTTATATELASLGFQSMTGGASQTTGQLPTGATLTNLAIVGSTLYAIAQGQADPVFGTATANTFGYGNRLVTIKDILTGKVTPKGPVFKTGAVPTVATPTSATLTWTAVTGATAYDVWYSTTSTFTAATTTKAPGLTTTSLTANTKTVDGVASAGLLSGVTYYWQVRVSAPVVGGWSAAWSFYTALPAMTDPGALTPYFPTLGKTEVSITPTFTWPTVAGATNYEFVIGEDPTFKIIDSSANTGLINAYTLAEPLRYSTVYYWRVRGTTELPVSAKSLAQGGAWATLTFTTIAEPVVVEKVEPAVIVQPGETKIQVVQVPVEKVVPQAIPSYLLWTIIAVGAVLIIALIILIVRTRRVT